MSLVPLGASSARFERRAALANRREPVWGLGRSPKEIIECRPPAKPGREAAAEVWQDFRRAALWALALAMAAAMSVGCKSPVKAGTPCQATSQLVCLAHDH